MAFLFPHSLACLCGAEAEGSLALMRRHSMREAPENNDNKLVMQCGFVSFCFRNEIPGGQLSMTQACSSILEVKIRIRKQRGRALVGQACFF